MKRLVLLLLSLAMVSGCTSQPSQPAAKPEAPEVLTGRSAFQKLYVSARGWAGDVRPYQLQSGVVGDNTGHDGKAVVWSASFASAALHTSKPYTWSGIDAPDAPSRGVSPGTQDTSFTPTNTFDMQFLKIDSDKAFEVAQKHGGQEILQKKPNAPVLYRLDWNSSGNKLIWHVMYGGTGADAALTADVDATTGEFLRKEK
jgi:hypothetical protein